MRSLDTPEKMNSPTNLALSREGFVVANFPGGHVVAFTANGNRLRHEIHNDHIQVISVLDVKKLFWKLVYQSFSVLFEIFLNKFYS